MKNIIKENSLYLVGLAIAESILSVIATLSFVYTDSLTYSKSLVIQMLGIEKLLETMYTSTWWALVLLLIFFVALFSIMTLLYKDLKYMVISIGCTIELFLLSINLTRSIGEILLNILIFIPIFILNIIAYRNESKKINETNKHKKIKTSK
jgi:hypothetical protein